MTGANTLTAAQATTLAGLNGFSVGTAATLAVSDSAANLQDLSAQTLGSLTGSSLANGVTLSATDASVAFNAQQTAAILSAGIGVSTIAGSTVTETFSDNTSLTFGGDGSGAWTLSLTGAG